MTTIPERLITTARKFTATDVLVLSFHVFLSVLAVLYAPRIEGWAGILAYNLLFSAAVVLLSAKSGEGSRLIDFVHSWYILPMIIATYKEMHVLVHSIRTELYDGYLIAFDRFVFGADPTAVLSRFSHPLLTEVLQIVYVLFYLFPVLLGLAMLRKKRYRAFEFVAFLVMYGFFLSYLGYLAFPAVGPRFTLHDFGRIDAELPGLFLTPAIREFVNLGESITSNMPHAELYVQRDVFPSGHTLITLITIYLAIRLKTRTRFVLVPAGLVLIFSTIYLRYHYAADLAGAFVFFLFAVASGRHLFNRWQRTTGRPPFEF